MGIDTFMMCVFRALSTSGTLNFEVQVHCTMSYDSKTTVDFFNIILLTTGLLLVQGDQENEIFSYFYDRVKPSFTLCPP